MKNPFSLSDDDLRTLMQSYTAWSLGNEEEKDYAKDMENRVGDIKAKLLNKIYLNKAIREQLIEYLLQYLKTLEGPAGIRIGKPRVTNELEKLRENLLYLIDSPDDPFEKASKILEGDYKIPFFSKAFCSPIFQAQYSELLPNWNNKTENFLKKVGVNIKTSKLSIKQKWHAIHNCLYGVDIDAGPSRSPNFASGFLS